ncbi:MSCRAMM family protein, partial [Glycomyces rutgersensis]
MAIALSVLLALIASMMVFDRPAQAQASGAWNEWADFAGGAGDYRATTTFATGPFIAGAIGSNSRGGGVGIISGASTWLSAGTPIGAKYGASRNSPYLNLRPQADRADSPSYTRYVFDEPVPPGGWAFALGDIDADQVEVVAKGPDGSALSAAQLGFQGTFNYCGSASAGGPACSGDGTDQPTWNAATRTLTGNAAAADTDGASGWFEPTVEVQSLTFVFTRRAGFPVYQTWFASLGCDITGAVTDSGAAAEGVTVNLIDEAGHVLDSTATAADGSYSFADYMIGGRYTVEVIAPDGKIVDGAKRQQVDLSSCPAAAADFQVRDIVPTSVGGTVSTTDGEDLGGISVTLRLENGDTVTTVTDSNGDYLFDDVPAGAHVIVIERPAGYDYEGVEERPVTVAPAQTTPITGQDFLLTQRPDVAGTATACGEPVGGVTVTLTGPGGSTESTVTDGSGAHRFAGLTEGDYSVEADVPVGHTAVGSTTRDVTIAADVDVEDVDFVFSRPTAVVGTVTGPGGDPLGGVRLTVTPEGDSPRQAATAEDGTYSVGDLPPGTHTVAIAAPAGYEVDGEDERTVSNTGTCSDAVADFALVEADEPGDPGDAGTGDPAPGDSGPGEPAPGADPGEDPTGGPYDGEYEGEYIGDDLPGTGMNLWLGIAAAVFLLGGGAVMIAAARAERSEASDP